MDPPIEIHDEFRDLNPTERSESMARMLLEIEDRMADNNTRILSRVLDLIAATEGDEQFHLDMLATHLLKETSEVLDVVKWPGDDKEWAGITRLSDFMPQTGSGSETGVCPWGYDARGRGFPSDQALKSLQALKEAVRRKACRELLGSAAESLELPADYCEFYKQTAGVYCDNWDRTMFVCDFARWFRSADKQAQDLDKMCEYSGVRDMEVAAGWLAGDNGQNSWIYYLLCKDDEDSDEPWQWRIFYTDIDSADGRAFDSLHEFLDWYASGYNRVSWRHVEMGIEDLHETCKQENDTYA